MKLSPGFCGTIGKTPLIRLNKLSNATGCEILGKAEFLNPGGSVKDRAALGIVEDAERRGLLKPGGTIVEGTAGNTGIGLALVGNAKGYKTIIVIPNTQSPEKMDLLRAIGAEVQPVPPAPYSDQGNYNHIANRLAEETDNGFWANQFDNVANTEFHFATTGPEIWDQTEGKVTAFVTSIGTGGTLAGVSTYLKSQNDQVQTVCVDPYGASMWSWFKHGHLDFDDGDSIAEGIGQSRVTDNVAKAKIDNAYRLHDRHMMCILKHLINEEGLFLGASSGINVGGAVKVALDGGPGQTIVTVLCDTAQKYMSRLFDQEWLTENDLPPEDLSIDAMIEEMKAEL
ncbi:MAG: cysteine synthase A [Verrucomicrobia bacterium]|nr:cysteine synthase A [Verrucomicrobiota bacterium]